MKTTGFRSGVLYFILALLLGGMIWLVFNIFAHGQNWITKPYNGHIYAGDASVETGDILDSNGVFLAYNQESTRVYHSDENTRKSLLHTVGDSSGYISTSVQASLRARLVGYNAITGLNNLPYNPYFGSQDVMLTIDSELSKKAYEALNGKNGAILISNYETGEILCKVSTPTYDPMNIPSDLLENPIYSGVFLDNTISSSYTPGSIFKLVTIAAIIENTPDWESKTHTCEGVYYLENSQVTCLGTHGNINVQQALGYSCNIYFAKESLELGSDVLQQTADSMGFNKGFSFADFSTTASSISLGNSTDLELAWASVGQHTTLMTPAHALLMAQAIANEGKSVPLRITEQGIFDGFGDGDIELMSAEVANELTELMRNTVSDYYGDSFFSGMDICAKTGTAEVGGKSPNSWIMGFSDNPDTPYAFAVVVEEGGGGLATAGGIISSLLSSIND